VKNGMTSVQLRGCGVCDHSCADGMWI